MISKINTINNNYSQCVAFQSKLPEFSTPKTPKVKDNFINSKNGKGIFTKLLLGGTVLFTKLFTGLAALFTKTKIDSNEEINAAGNNYESYTQPVSIHINPENMVVCPNGEELNMKQMFEQQAGDCWRDCGRLKCAVILNPNMSMKELKKFIPEMKYNEYVQKWEIPCPGFSGIKIDLHNNNILIEKKSNKSSNNSHSLVNTNYAFGDVVIPKQSVIDGNIRQLDFDKIDNLYNKIFEYYNHAPSKFVFIKEGTTIKNEGEISIIKEDSVIIYPAIWQGGKNISVVPLKKFISNYKPTVNELSAEKYESLKNNVREYFEITTPKGRKFDIHNNTYRIDEIEFEKIKNLRDGGSMDGWYWDTETISGEELDELYDKYYKVAIDKSAKKVTYVSDTGNISIH